MPAGPIPAAALPHKRTKMKGGIYMKKIQLSDENKSILHILTKKRMGRNTKRLQDGLYR